MWGYNEKMTVFSIVVSNSALNLHGNCSTSHGKMLNIFSHAYFPSVYSLLSSIWVFCSCLNCIIVLLFWEFFMNILDESFARYVICNIFSWSVSVVRGNLPQALCFPAHSLLSEALTMLYPSHLSPWGLCCLTPTKSRLASACYESSESTKLSISSSYTVYCVGRHPWWALYITPQDFGVRGWYKHHTNTLATTFAVNNNVPCLWFCSLVSSASIHETRTG